jgi:carbonic anhydrase
MNSIDKHDDDYKQLFINNRSWVEKKLAKSPKYFEKLAAGQAPKFLFIGCSDSRVPANQITGTSHGDIFVHRNIANVVVHTDMNLMSVLQYAVEVLKIKHVIICGHYGCGGVKAAMETQHHGLIDNWLRNIKDVYRLYSKELDAIADENARMNRLVELNVREQVYKICMTSIIQKAWHFESALHVHGWVYDIKDGLIKDLNVDILKDFNDYKIYDFDDDSLKSTSK